MEPRGCDCCDPTHDSPDPVVVRLEAELENARAQAEAMTKGLVKSSAKRMELESQLAEARAALAEREEAARHMLECMIAADWKRNVIDCVDRWRWLNDQYTGE